MKASAFHNNASPHYRHYIKRSLINFTHLNILYNLHKIMKAVLQDEDQEPPLKKKEIEKKDGIFWINCGTLFNVLVTFLPLQEIDDVHPLSINIHFIRSFFFFFLSLFSLVCRLLAKMTIIGGRRVWMLWVARLA